VTLTGDWTYSDHPPRKKAPFLLAPAARVVRDTVGGTIWCNICGGAPSRPFGDGMAYGCKGYRLYMRSGDRAFWRMLGGE
jgi:hypothetical protein